MFEKTKNSNDNISTTIITNIAGINKGIEAIEKYKEEIITFKDKITFKSEENFIQKNANDVNEENQNDISVIYCPKDYRDKSKYCYCKDPIKEFGDEKSDNSEEYKIVFGNVGIENKIESDDESFPKKEKETNPDKVDIKKDTPENICTVDNKQNNSIQKPLLNKKRKRNKNSSPDKEKTSRNSSIHKIKAKKKRSNHDYLIKRFLSSLLNKYIFKKLRKFNIHKCNYKINIKPNEKGLSALLIKTVKEVFTIYDKKASEGTSNQQKNKTIIEEKINTLTLVEKEELKKLLDSYIEEQVIMFYKSPEFEELKKKVCKNGKTIKDLDEEFFKERKRGYYLLKIYENENEKTNGFIKYANSKPYCHNERKK